MQAKHETFLFLLLLTVLSFLTVSVSFQSFKNKSTTHDLKTNLSLSFTWFVRWYWTDLLKVVLHYQTAAHIFFYTTINDGKCFTKSSVYLVEWSQCLYFPCKRFVAQWVSILKLLIWVLIIIFTTVFSATNLSWPT